MLEILETAFWQTATALTGLIVPIIVIRLVLDLFTDIIFNKGR